jgi:lipopolysaccharide/colanic/teichoic acid biosynthesis glycosyltransferase
VVIGSYAALDRLLTEQRIPGGGALPSVTLRLPDVEDDESPCTVMGRIESVLSDARVSRVVVALPLPRGCDSEAVLGRLVDLDVPVSLIDCEAKERDALRPESKGPRTAAIRRIEIAAKAIIDRVGAALLLALLTPLLLLIWLAIRATSKGPGLFVQPRLGRGNAIIPVVKFRTMYVDRGDRSGGLRTVPNDPRVTRLGRVLRRWSLDELPQLLNVLAGQMSLIGPRPHALMMKAGERLYLEAVPGYLNRHGVRPGITGWAQVNRLSGEVESAKAGHARLIHDLHYIENWSLWLDFAIFLKTIGLFFDRVNRY